MFQLLHNVFSDAKKAQLASKVRVSLKKGSSAFVVLKVTTLNFVEKHNGVQLQG
jgi:hypothetical protein